MPLSEAVYIATFPGERFHHSQPITPTQPSTSAETPEPYLKVIHVLGYDARSGVRFVLAFNLLPGLGPPPLELLVLLAFLSDITCRALESVSTRTMFYHFSGTGAEL